MYAELGHKNGRWNGEEVLETIRALARRARRARKAVAGSRGGGKAIAVSVLAAGFLAASLAYAADASAAYTAQVEADTLKINGDTASDKLVLRLQPGSPNTLEVDVGADGTADFSF